MENMSTTEPICDNSIEIEIICEKCCRTCSKSFDEHVTMSPIFQVFTVGTNNKYKFKIADELNLLNIKIDKNDGLPQEICINCMAKVIQLFLFRKLCEFSQTKLRNLYDSNYKINLDDLIKCETANELHNIDQDNGASQIPLPSQKSVDKSNLPNVLLPADVNVTNMELEPKKTESTIQNDVILIDSANAIEFLSKNNNYSTNDDDRKSEASFSDAQPNHSDEEDCDADNEPILEDINMETDVENTEEPITPPSNSVNDLFLTNTEDESARSNEIQKCSALIQTAVEQHVQEQSNNDTIEENEVLPENDNYSINDDDRRSEASFSDAQPNHSDEEDCDADNELILEDITIEIDVENTEEPITPLSNKVNGYLSKDMEDNSIGSNEVQKWSALIQTAMEQNDTTDKNDVNLNLSNRNGKNKSLFELIMCRICNKYKYNGRIRADQDYCMEWKKNNTLIQSLETDYCCFYCNENFYSMTVLQNHAIKTHTYKKPFKCATCDKKFMLYKAKMRHCVEKHSRYTEINCPICNKKIKSKVEFYSHMRDHKLNNRTINIQKRVLVNDFKKKDIKLCGIKLCDICKKYKFLTRFKRDKAPCDIFKTNLRIPLNPDGDYICYYCNLNFDKENLLKDHMVNDHSIEKPFKCKKCDEELTSMSARVEHYQRCHKNILPYECPICDIKFKSERSYIKHRVFFHSEIKYECEICSKKFYTSQQLIIHKKKNEIKKRKCKYCNQNNIDLHHIKLHKREHDNIAEEIAENENKVITLCNICKKYKFSKRFKEDRVICLPYKKNLREHVDGYFVCYYCNSNFKNESLLKDHMLNDHSFEKPFKCIKCDEIFSSVSTRLEHYKKCHKEIDPFECPICYLRLPNRNRLVVHRNRFHTDGYYECKICSKKFYSLNQLEGHTKYHTNNRKYKCKYCDKMFYQQDHVISHERVHTKEKPFMCETCGKQFRLREDFTKHLRIHTGENLSICEYCGKSFPAIHLLNSHVRASHGGVRGKRVSRKNTKYKCTQSKASFECPLCKKTFHTPLGLQRHLKIHDENRKYKCSQCSYSYTHASSLKLHLRRNHPKEGVFVCCCAKEFSTLEEKIEHQKNVHKAKVYNCKYCHKFFKNNVTFIRHIRVHRNEKLFKCLICGDNFLSNYQLQSHTRRDHNTDERKQIEEDILAEAKIDQQCQKD